jgi:NADP-dependent 3-hydroxy acid dehydrogenase YdfG
MVDTEFFDAGAPDWALRDEDISAAVLYALEQPQHVEVNEVLVRPTRQPM